MDYLVLKTLASAGSLSWVGLVVLTGSARACGACAGGGKKEAWQVKT